MSKKTIKETAWQKHYAELQVYKTEYGHCRVPAKYLVNPQLSGWGVIGRFMSDVEFAV